jgi:hypothetical protein
MALANKKQIKSAEGKLNAKYQYHPIHQPCQKINKIKQNKLSHSE